MPIASIVFMQGDEGRRVTDAISHFDGNVTHHGATAASIEAAVDYLAQWDYGEYHDLKSVTDAGAMDDLAQIDHYLLTWNVRLGYVGLEVLLDDDTHQPVDVTTCRGCNEPIDYCTDHTHAPDTESDEWQTDYDAVTAALNTQED